MSNIKREEKIKAGVKIGGFYVTAPWDDEDSVYIKEAVIRNFDGELWAEHIDPQYDYTQVEDSKEWREKIIK